MGGGAMRIAVCENSQMAAEQFCGWVRRYCALYRVPAMLRSFLSPDDFSSQKERYDIVFIAFGGHSGFSQARLLRERDRNCRIILVDDTQEFAVHCVRLHCTDFILRPVEFQHVVRSMRLALRRGL